MKKIEIFRPGTHVAQDGKEHTFTADHVAAIAAGYDPVAFAAPAVIGHPKTEDPAYGWVSALSIDDNGVLVADLDKLDPTFAEGVEAGRWPKVSASLYAPTSKGNPNPGQFSLRHVGFLGAAAPGVKGLTPVNFSEGDDFLEFGGDIDERRLAGSVRWLATVVSRLFRRQREQLIEQHGVEKADELLPSWEADAPSEIAAEIQAELNRTETPRLTYAEGEGDDQVTAELRERIAAIDAREAGVAERETAAAARDLAFAEGEAQARRDDDKTFIQGLVDAGRLPPGHAPAMLTFCAALDGADAISFAEGEAAVDPRAGFREFLGKNLGEAIVLREVAPSGDVAFAEGEDPAAFASRIRQHQADAAARGETLSASQAAAQLARA